MGGVHGFAGLAHTKALNGFGEDECRLAFMLNGTVVSSEDLE